MVILGKLAADPPRRMDGLLRRAWWMLRQPSRWMSYFVPRKGAAIRAWQRYKGVR